MSTYPIYAIFVTMFSLVFMVKNRGKSMSKVSDRYSTGSFGF